MRADIAQFEFVDKKIRVIISWLELETGLEFTATSLYRIGDNGVHGTLPLRGVDLRIRSYMVGKVFESIINENWQYDPNRPNKNCAKIHGNGSNLHLHLQVHPNTTRRG
jgi:hypothetical protein